MKRMPVSEVKAKLIRLIAKIEATDEEIVALMKEIRRGLRAPKRSLTRREAAALFR